jgi:hypothetical protein
LHIVFYLSILLMPFRLLFLFLHATPAAAMLLFCVDLFGLYVTHRLAISIGCYGEGAPKLVMDRSQTSPSRAVGHAILWSTLRVVRESRRFRRATSSVKVPDLLREVAKTLLKYLSPIQLLPTVLAVGMAPDHFFRRIRQISTGHNKVYKTPVEFLLSSASQLSFLAFIGLRGLGIHLDEKTVFKMLLVAAAATPITMVGLCVVTVFIYYGGLMPSIFWVINSRLIKLDPDVPRKIFSIKTYRRIDSNLFLSSIPYFAVYSFCGLIAVGVCVALLFPFWSLWFVEPFATDVKTQGQWTMNLAGALVATAIVVGQRLILARYALMLAVLEESSGRPIVTSA